MFSFKSLLKSLDHFFFAPKPVDSIALFRIIWCLLILATAMMDVNNINEFYGPHGLLSLTTAKSQFMFPHMNVFHYFSSSYEMTYILFGIYFVAILFAMVGLFTRASLIVTLVCMVSIHQRNIWLLSSSELLLRLITLYLVFSPCGHVFSFDSILGRKYKLFAKPREWSPWVLRMIQIQVSVVYLWTVWHKLKGDTWIDGTAVYYATRAENMKNFGLPFLLDWMPFLKFMTWSTLVLEFVLGCFIWFKEFRWPLIVSGVIFHLGIEYVMSIPFFEWIMILLILLYITPEEVRFFIKKQKQNWVSAVNETNLSSSIKEKINWLIIGEKV